MKRLSESAIRSRLEREQAFMMLTHGEGYSLNDGSPVGIKTAHSLMGDLFSDCAPVVVPNDDGLFPGHSQTWSLPSNGQD